MPGPVAATPKANRNRSTSSINASLGNPDRRPPATHDAGQARVRTPANHPIPGNHRLTATPDPPSFPSALTTQAVLPRSRRRVGALDLPSLQDSIAREADAAPQKVANVSVLERYDTRAVAGHGEGRRLGYASRKRTLRSAFANQNFGKVAVRWVHSTAASVVFDDCSGAP